MPQHRQCCRLLCLFPASWLLVLCFFGKQYSSAHAQSCGSMRKCKKGEGCERCDHWRVRESKSLAEGETACYTKWPRCVNPYLCGIIIRRTYKESYCQGCSSCTKCEVGRYGPKSDGHWGGSCYDCAYGRFSNETGVTACGGECPVGKGTILKGSPGPEACKECDAGRYLDDGQCVNCAAGKYSTAVGATSDLTCVQCSPGRWSSAGAMACTDCPKGRWGDGKKSCQLCPLGKFATAEGARDEKVCTDCEAGKFNIHRGHSSCQTCVPGRWNEAIGLSNCKFCAAGTFSLSYGATSSSMCEVCGAGNWSQKGASVCSVCQAGRVSSAGSGSCSGCVAGRYSTYGSSECTPCAIGKWSRAWAADCNLCAAGKFSAAESSSCTSCEAGKWSADLGSSDCLPCEPGSYGAEIGAASIDTCTACTAGTWSPNFSVPCIPCDAGKWSGNTTSCRPCPAGRWSSESGALDENSCKLCPIGTASLTLAASDESSCISCGPGSWSEAGSTECSSCPAGTWSEVAVRSAESCSSCPRARFSNVSGSSSGSTCKICEAGTWTDSEGSSSCQSCAAGMFGATIGASSNSTCELCKAGTWSESEGSSNCQSCVSGMFNPIIGASSVSDCKLCIPGRWSNKIGATMCMLCPAGTWLSENGAVSPANCTLCPAGKFGIPNGSMSEHDCVECPSGRASTAIGASNASVCTDIEAEKSDDQVIVVMGLVLGICGICFCCLTFYCCCISKKKPASKTKIAQADMGGGWTDISYPTSWLNADVPLGERFDQIVNVPKSAYPVFQNILDHTYRAVVTADRPCPKKIHDKVAGGCPCVQVDGDPGLPVGFRLRRVCRIENGDMWQRYSTCRDVIREKRSSEKIRSITPPVKTNDIVDGLPAYFDALDHNLNEVYLLHGTFIRDALSIAHTDFRLSTAGMYGAGVYLGDSSTKADEYAQDEPGGFYDRVHPMLLCRACMGKVYYTTKRDPEAHGKITSGEHDSTLGDREKSVGTFREFTVYDKDQVYPEYLLLYERIYNDSTGSGVFGVGEKVEATEFPGQRGILQKYDADAKSWTVNLESGQVVQVAAVNLQGKLRMVMQIPVYWQNFFKDPEKQSFDDRFPVRPQGKKLLQELLDKTGSIVQIRSAERIEHSQRWLLYQRRKRAIFNTRRTCQRVVQLAPSSKPVQTKEILKSMKLTVGEVSIENMEENLNEYLLFHGTSAENAESIVKRGFRIGPVAHGMRFGSGVYLSEQVTKSLDYASTDKEGNQWLLVCRVVCGELYFTEQHQDSSAPENARAANKDSVLAQPSSAPREFIVWNTESVYPEFVLQVQR